MTRRKQAAVAALGALLLAAGAVSWNQLGGLASRPSAVSSTASASHDSRISAAAARQHGHGWNVGSRRSYATEFSSELKGDEKSPNGAVLIRGTAKLELTAASVNDQGQVLQGRFSDLTLTGGGARSTIQAIEGGIRDELLRPFLIRVKASGEVESVEIEPAVRGLGSRVLRSVVAALAFKAPEGASSSWNEWTTQEADQNGVFKARYRQVAPGTFSKTKLEYSYLDVAHRVNLGAGSPKPAISGEATIQRSTDGVIRSVESKEQMRVPMGNGAYTANSRIALELEKADTAAVSFLDASRLVSVALHDNEAVAGGARRSSEESKRALVGNATMKALMSELASTPATRENAKARWAITRRMTALVELAPENAGSIVEALKSDPSAPGKDMLLAALSDARDPEGQNALAELARDPALDAGLRGDAINHLGLQEEPTHETLDSLTTLAKSTQEPGTRSAATLALGSAAGKVTESDPSNEVAQGAVTALESSLNAASDARERRLYLEALGNAGSATTLKSLEKSLQDPDPAIRRTAVEALRKVPGAQADALIVGALHDPDQGVRGGAIQALSTRALNADLVAALGATLAKDASPALRIQAANVLGRNLRRFSSILALLEQARDHDPREEVRAAAAKAIKNQPASAAPSPP